MLSNTNKINELSVIDELIGFIRNKIDTTDLIVDSVVVGVFYTGVKLNTGHGGIAFTPIHDIPDAVCCPRSYAKMPNSGYLSRQSLEDVLRETVNTSPLKSAIGVAAINAVSQKILFDEEYESHKIVFDSDPLDMIEINPDDTVVMIGAFTPYIKRLKGKVNNLYVIERNVRAISKEDITTYPEESRRELLPKTDILIASGSTIVNQTIDEILSLSEKAREIILSGPTASVIPDPLFKRGVTCIGGMKIYDPDRMLKIVSEAGSGYSLLKECAKKMVLTRA